MQPVVLIIEDHDDTRRTLEEILFSANFTVQSVDSRQEALRLLNAGRLPACIVTDYLMPGMSMTEFVEKTKAFGTRIVLMTVLKQIDQIAARLGLRYFVQKPISPDELVRMVKLAIESGEHAAIRP